ncbi:hypothetical protein [Pelodictyon luteolum]|nr:hypothetical protein [Pelodictyon luteolum]
MRRSSLEELRENDFEIDGLTGYRCSDSPMRVSIQLPIFWISPTKWTA